MHQNNEWIGSIGRRFEAKKTSGDMLIQNFILTTWEYRKDLQRTVYYNHKVTAMGKMAEKINLLPEKTLIMAMVNICPTYNKETKKSYINIYVNNMRILKEPEGEGQSLQTESQEFDFSEDFGDDDDAPF